MDCVLISIKEAPSVSMIKTGIAPSGLTIENNALNAARNISIFIVRSRKIKLKFDSCSVVFISSKSACKIDLKLLPWWTLDN